MAAIATIMKMKCIRLQTAGLGQPEVVTLRETQDNDTAKTNIKVMPQANPQPKAEMDIVITKGTSQGVFKKDQHYRIDFTEIT